MNMTTAPDGLNSLCQRYRIQRLAVFGSVLHGTPHAASDLDLLVEFAPDAHIGWAFIALQDALTALFGQSVDLHTPASLSRHFRQQVLDEARVIYERA